MFVHKYEYEYEYVFVHALVAESVFELIAIPIRVRLPGLSCIHHTRSKNWRQLGVCGEEISRQ